MLNFKYIWKTSVGNWHLLTCLVHVSAIALSTPYTYHTTVHISQWVRILPGDQTTNLVYTKCLSNTGCSLLWGEQKGGHLVGRSPIPSQKSMPPRQPPLVYTYVLEFLDSSLLLPHWVALSNLSRSLSTDSGIQQHAIFSIEELALMYWYYAWNRQQHDHLRLSLSVIIASQNSQTKNATTSELVMHSLSDDKIPPLPDLFVLY